jgi:hypothetical protein
MKTIKIIYWVSTILLAAMMLMSAVTSIINNPGSVEFMTRHLFYPPYFSQFLGVAKVLGVIALFVPGYPRVREWAYAGFTFDLISAIYSFIKVGDPVKVWILAAITLIILIVSYTYWHKKSRVEDRIDAVV